MNWLVQNQKIGLMNGEVNMNYDRTDYVKKLKNKRKKKKKKVKRDYSTDYPVLPPNAPPWGGQ